jgi:aldehyde:ferredoxin oxidoreductase
LFSAATGLPPEFIDVGVQRGYNIQRAIMLREGRQVPSDDFPREINFTQGLKTSPPVPGPGDTPVDVTGRTLDRKIFQAMLKEYYRLRGWNEETGRPRRETLTALGLEDILIV